VDEEEDLIAQKVHPMQSDFHFYAMDHKERQMTIAREIVQRHIPTDSKTSSSEDEGMDPYLAITCLNERLMKCWEQENPQVRSEYFAKEEDDRRRFMTEDEIASRHCATLTARAKSPKTGKSGDTGHIVGLVAPSPLSLSLMKTEGDGGEGTRLVGSKRQSCVDAGAEAHAEVDGESPTKKSKEVGGNIREKLEHGPGTFAKGLIIGGTNPGLSIETSGIKQEHTDVKMKVETAHLELNVNAKYQDCDPVASVTKTILSQDETCNMRDRIAEAIIECREIDGKEECLVRWKGCEKENDTWEPAEKMIHLRMIL